MNIPLPTDFLEGFKKQKIPKSNLEEFVERTRKSKQQNLTIPHSDKVTDLGEMHLKGQLVLPPPDVAKIHAKMTNYIRRKMFERGIQVQLWKVGYEHVHQGTHIESKLKIAKQGEITIEEKEIMDKLMKELDSIPPGIFQKIMEME